MCIVAYFDSLYVVGSRDEAMNIRGLRYHPVDIESTVVRSHKNIVERLLNTNLSALVHVVLCSAVFTWTKLLVVVAELGADEKAALDIVPVITSSLLEEHQVKILEYTSLNEMLITFRLLLVLWW